jgi:hypothetical protein
MRPRFGGGRIAFLLMEISPASITQLRQARNGRGPPSGRGGRCGRDLRDIDSSLRLRKSEENGIYVVYQVDGRAMRVW